jgi:two-component system OmpR family sensor kinase
MAGRSMRLSTRLLCLYALLVAATLLVVAGIVIPLTRSHLTRHLDDQLEATATSFATGPAKGVNSAQELGDRTRSWLEMTSLPADQEVLVRTVDGLVLATRGESLVLELRGGHRLLRAEHARSWALGGRESSVRAVTVPIRHDGKHMGTLVVAAREARIDATLSDLMSGIGLATGIGFAFAALAGYGALRRTLKPLTRVTDEVETIESTGDLSRRLHHSGPLDEVGRLSAAFDHTLGRLQEAFASQRRFVSDASHELRTPLTIARGQLELLQSTIGDARQQRTLSTAVEELERMGKIVDELLLLARLDEGLLIHCRPVEVELVVREALLRGLLLERRAARTQVEPDVFALADPDRLLQVITNLVTNAIQHTSERTAITLSAHRVDGDVVIEVADSGSGIPQADMAHVFKRMYRGPGARASSPGGAGLGLPIAASLVEAMGGTIDVASRPGRTAFTVRLPAVDDASATDGVH